MSMADAVSDRSRAIRMELVAMTTSDGIELDAALYRPRDGAQRPAMGFLLVHGIKWNFYRGPSRWLGPLLAGAGFACLAPSLRDHDSAEPAPDALDNAEHDLRAGLDLLGEHCDETMLFAHGYGCVKAIRYALTGDTRVARRVLTTLGAVHNYQPAAWRRALESAVALRGRTLVVQGGADPAVEGRARADELAAAAPKSITDIIVLDGADHYFAAHRDTLVGVVKQWAESGRRR
jgi:pimeloyl-ACP methyl ester carboxylesterase